MEDSDKSERDQLITPAKITEITAFALFVAILFALVRLHFYYVLLLHIPIFQYLDVSEIVLMTPTTGITWFVYLACINIVPKLQKNEEFTLLQKIIFSLILYALATTYVWMSYRNDSIMREVLLMPFHKGRWWWYFSLVILVVIPFLYPDKEGPKFFKKHIYILPLIITIWYGIYESWANYELVKEANVTAVIRIKTKTHGIINLGQNLVNAGRTKDYWFIYNRKTKFTRVIKVDDIDTVDFKENLF
jgi:hypothetical protein